MPSAPRVPDRPTVDGLDVAWSTQWERDGVYRFDRSASRDRVYSIDTPPPTVSGSLHVGHVFSFTHTDLIARYRRMCGYEVFYPMGWDDNGLPTERRVQNYFGVRCDPSLPYDPSYVPPAEPAKEQVSIARGNFIELCHQLTAEDEVAFEAMFRRLGLSVDWTHTYQTIDDRARATSQRAFLRNFERGEVYQAEAPTLWDVTFRTAVAQAELEDRERPGAYYRIAFAGSNGAPIVIDTTRPELLAACVALVAHPDDKRYQALFGSTARTPLFDVEVPVVAHRLADPEKGTGVAMICTFGDTTDVTWWRELSLPTRPIVGWDGRILRDVRDWIASAAGRDAYERIAGATAHTARERSAEMLRTSGALIGEPRAITHPVKFYEKGDRPLEIVTTRQWYLTNGGRDEQLRERLLARGAELHWHPEHMKIRYDNWVGGLLGDWLLSRQRFFGVPIPLWYAVDSHGQPDFDTVLVPSEERLPIDPSSDVPAEYDESQRGKPHGFIGDLDILDTWATSSLTPQIAGGWERDPDLWSRVWPMDLRPQAHEIIRTWLFSTVVRAHLEDGVLPWSDAAISGWILDPDRKKMSKSKGNVVTPVDLLDEYGSDAVRYWAASGRPGADTAYEIGQMKIGRRLAIKILNAAKFILSSAADASDDGSLITEQIDKALIADLRTVIAAATDAFETYDYTRALEATETFFWRLCDDHLELVKERAYGSRGLAAQQSAHAALLRTLRVVVRLFAPVLPFATEEVWSWWREGSVHRAAWPTLDELADISADVDPGLSGDVATVLTAIRRAKTEAKVSMRHPAAVVTITGLAAQIDRIRLAAADLIETGHVEKLDLVVAPGELQVDVKLT